MAKIVTSGNYTAKHTGKSGYVSTNPRGGAPIPYSFIEEIASNLYPEVREFIPKDYRSYTDSYYDLRNKQYKYWYDKWGKPHINKWWKSQLEYEKILAKAISPWKKKSNGSYTYSKYYGPTNRYKYLKRGSGMHTYCKCGRVNNFRPNGWRQRPRRKQRFSYW